MKTLKQFQYFIAIVEQGSFTAASEQLFIAQSALSRQIKILEEEIGFVLFDRTEKKIQLTAAGQAFYQKLKMHLLNIEHSIETAHSIAHGHGRFLQLAHSSSIVMDAVKIQHLNQLAEKYSFEIEINTVSSEQQIEAVLNGSVDLGLIRPHVLRNLQDVHCTDLYAEPLFAAVHQDDPMFQQKDYINVAELSQKKFVSTPHAERGGLSYLAANLCINHGFYPQNASIRSRKASQLSLVQAGLGICIVPKEFKSILPSSVKLIALHPAPQLSKVCLIWNKDADDVVQKAAAELQKLFSKQD
ncbi:LysR family transcriptional regulator [Acinetobacter sp. ANC 5054]|uniref:LysR family transcriptional regulator n=1 Tax=Acinetobacter sp. ANC 5054 TaxID=1977877 RepID=UPI000A32EB5B|nr:LysR family transcriptional regulator [Acinetobacter sp. ANC 5054]OTG80179.1 LysR family transcriptional regulator [Acinetobacter sp. ANC 5054]